VCDENDQLFAIASNGVVIRTRVGEIRPSGRDTMGVTLMNLAEGDTVVAVARGTESEGDDDEEPGDEVVEAVADDEVAVVDATPIDGEAGE
jgi:hypothetical protein